jgi:hypothetical protein
MKWRTGRKNPRTIYLQQGPTPSDSDPFIGTLDSADLVRLAVDAVNEKLGQVETTLTEAEKPPCP